MQCGAGHLGRVKHAHFNHIAVLACGRVVAIVVLTVDDGIDHDGGFITRIGNDFTQRLFDGAQHDLDTSVLIGVIPLEFSANCRPGTQ